jgi:chromosome segregation ATPase
MTQRDEFERFKAEAEKMPRKEINAAYAHLVSDQYEYQLQLDAARAEVERLKKEDSESVEIFLGAIKDRDNALVEVDTLRATILALREALEEYMQSLENDGNAYRKARKTLHDTSTAAKEAESAIIRKCIDAIESTIGSHEPVALVAYGRQDGKRKAVAILEELLKAGGEGQDG